MHAETSAVTNSGSNRAGQQWLPALGCNRPSLQTTLLAMSGEIDGGVCSTLWRWTKAGRLGEQRACVRFAHRHLFVISSARSTSPILRCAMTSVSRLDNLSRRREVSYWSMSFNLTSDRCLQSGIISTIFLILLGIFCCWPLQSPGYLLTSAVTRWSVLEFFFFGNTYLYFIWQLQSGGHLGICRHFYHLAPSQSS